MRNANSFVDGVLGDWQVSTISLVESGPFMTATISPGLSQSNLNEIGRQIPVRPDQIGNCNLPHPTPGDWFNAAAFVPTPPGAGRVGNAKVGSCVGPRTVAIAGGSRRTSRYRKNLGCDSMPPSRICSIIRISLLHRLLSGRLLSALRAQFRLKKMRAIG